MSVSPDPKKFVSVDEIERRCRARLSRPSGSYVWYRIGHLPWKCSSLISDHTALFPSIEHNPFSARHPRCARELATELRESGFETRIAAFPPTC